ncbi:MAG: outer membrane protein assembly factor BamC [Burkholderiaceae bacterium]
MNATKRLALLGLSLALGGCSVLEGDKVDYKSAGSAPSLAVPPDLTQLSRDNRYAIPGGPVTASNYQVGQASTSVPVAATSIGDVRIEREGNQRWLVVKRSPEALWDPIKDFWQEHGFLLSLDQKNLGIMETDWAENRAKIPQDIIRETLGKLLDSLYSTAERDRFRTRLERNAKGETEIFISHRGMIEVYPSGNKIAGAKDANTIWQPRPPDPELEAEFLRRLMVKLGVSQEQAKAVIAAGASKSSSQVSQVNGQPVVLVDDGFDRAWRRVGLSLDRTGFTVEDRDRSKGIYFVRYVEANPDKAEPGFFSKLFGASAKVNKPIKYQVIVRSQGESSVVSVLDTAGAPDSSANAKTIVKVLADDLK